jgi:hypothetical protein
MVDVIVAALAVGASAGVSGTATEAIKDAYGGLKALIRRRLIGREQARAALEAEETEPGVWRASIGHDLQESGAAADEQVLSAARELLVLTGSAGVSLPRVDASHAKGVQVGDRNIQNNSFN